MEFFIIKKWIGAVISPLPMLFILLTLLLISCWFSQAGKSIRRLTTLSWLWLLLFGTPMLPNAWLGQFEQQYPTYHFQQAGISDVVVLGCAHNENLIQPITSQVAECSLARLSEGIRILLHYPNARLSLSGGRVGTQARSNAEVVAELAVALGVKRSRIVTEPGAKDTAEEAQLLAPRLQGNSFVLVTSASHMPRAMQIFEAQGLKPIAAPTHFIAGQKGNSLQGIDYLPHPNHLEKSRRAFYETIGLIWVSLVELYHR